MITIGLPDTNVSVEPTLLNIQQNQLLINIKIDTMRVIVRTSGMLGSNASKRERAVREWLLSRREQLSSHDLCRHGGALDKLADFLL
jgi:hypothetical protein